MVGTLFANPIFLGGLFFLARAWSIWLPIVLGFIFWSAWTGYVRGYFMSNAKWILLEIKVPREQTKSPKAMESILAGINGTNRLGNMRSEEHTSELQSQFHLVC